MKHPRPKPDTSTGLTLKEHDSLRTKLLQLEHELKKSQDDNKRLKDSNQYKSEFLAMMSHELRTPLNAIIGFSEILKDGLSGKISHEQQKYLEYVFQNSTRLLTVINDVLDLSKIESGKMELHLDSVSIPEIASSSILLIKEKAYARNISLKTNIEAFSTNPVADARKCKQILSNLLSNAVKFTGEGGTVLLSARKVIKDTGTAFLEFQVDDSGIGIAPDDLSGLFQPFVQIPNEITRNSEGTGLGLVMVKQLAELHGGSVRVESVEGKGSSFFVQIPWRELNLTAEQEQDT